MDKEWAKIQEKSIPLINKAFTRWVNMHLKIANKPLINDIYDDLSTGENLLELFRKLLFIIRNYWKRVFGTVCKESQNSITANSKR
jgi:hypothetical protein